jgi:hypothetical protein
MWGVLNIYITSYFRIKSNPHLTIQIGGAIFPFMMCAVATGVPIGIKLIRKYGSAKKVCYVCSIFASLSIFISSFIETFWLFTLIYGVSFGFFTGVMYMIPIYLG